MLPHPRQCFSLLARRCSPLLLHARSFMHHQRSPMYPLARLCFLTLASASSHSLAYAPPSLACLSLPARLSSPRHLRLNMVSLHAHRSKPLHGPVRLQRGARRLGSELSACGEYGFVSYCGCSFSASCSLSLPSICLFGKGENTMSKPLMTHLCSTVRQCGYITDHSRQKYIVYKLTLLSSTLTLGCYLWLLLPAQWTTSALPGVVMFGLGQGFGTC